MDVFIIVVQIGCLVISIIAFAEAEYLRKKIKEGKLSMRSKDE